MSRRVPTCAWCGGRLRGDASIRVQYRSLPGSPEVGWHATTPTGCWTQDALFDQIVRDRDDLLPNDGVAGLIREIQARGADRVSAGKRWSK